MDDVDALHIESNQIAQNDAEPAHDTPEGM